MSFCGYIALIGRPNVGKSTLLNQILQVKLSITSRKPQTTRHRILGVSTVDDTQCIYLDTPGINHAHQQIMNRIMNKTAYRVLKEVDVVVFVVEATRWCDADELLLKRFQDVKVPVILAVNKVDKIKDKSTLYPVLQQLGAKYPFAAIVPISARNGLQVDKLQAVIKPYMPESPHLFDDDDFTDRPTQFLCAELVREKLFRFFGQELPYACNVAIEQFEASETLVKIHALIYVDKPNHKQMIIGEKGVKLKEISTEARLDMERLLGKKVFLRCWCKVKSGWANNEQILKSLGFEL